MNENAFDKLISFLNRLAAAKISYSLLHDREDMIMVIIAVPGERWEVEFGSDGKVEIERFISTGEIEYESTLGELFKRFSD